MCARERERERCKAAGFCHCPFECVWLLGKWDSSIFLGLFVSWRLVKNEDTINNLRQIFRIVKKKKIIFGLKVKSGIKKITNIVLIN